MRKWHCSGDALFKAVKLGCRTTLANAFRGYCRAYCTHRTRAEGKRGVCGDLGGAVDCVHKIAVMPETKRVLKTRSPKSSTFGGENGTAATFRQHHN